MYACIAVPSAEEIAEARLALVDLVGVEGMPLAASDIQARLDEPVARRSCCTLRGRSNAYLNYWA